jgi:arabinose-5-phosphate isomerase
MATSHMRPDTSSCDTAVDVLGYGREVLAAEIRGLTAVSTTLGAEFAAGVDLLTLCRGGVVTSGIGKSGLVARKISATFASLGTRSLFLHPAEATHGDLGSLASDDVVILLTYSGETDVLVSLASLLRSRGTTTIVITRSASSTVGRLCDLVLPLGELREACPFNLAPTTTTTAMMALGDALALTVAAVRDFRADDFKLLHPGGTLGCRLLPVRALLPRARTTACTIVRESDTLMAALDAAKGSPRSGAMLVVDRSGTLVGIFTDGDLRRLIASQGPSSLSQPIGDLMIRTPTTIRDDALVDELAAIFIDKRVDEVPVIDQSGRPAGLIDVQDLLALGVLPQAPDGCP